MTTIGLKMNRIFNYLDKIIKEAKPELVYNKDYELLIAVMLSAQTTDKGVNKVTKVLFDRYQTLEELSKARLKDLEKIIKPIGTYYKKARNVKNTAIKLKTIGYVPNDRLFIESLPGVGRKTTNVVLSILYNEPYLAVDTHVERVAKRLRLAYKNDSVLTVERKLTKKIPKERVSKTHHQLVLFGRYYCRARKPLCENCELKDICKYYKKGTD
ncbi:MAG: endonuclease III [Bacilli bacterium]|nr:endonuclease III [Bacilli bacterium]